LKINSIHVKIKKMHL